MRIVKHPNRNGSSFGRKRLILNSFSILEFYEYFEKALVGNASIAETILAFQSHCNLGNMNLLPISSGLRKTEVRLLLLVIMAG